MNTKRNRGAYYLGQYTYGAGYCAVCGDRGPNLVPTLAQYWDPDDGWRVGVLCSYCFRDAEQHPPAKCDYAYSGERESGDRIGALVEVLGDDADAILSTADELA